MLRILPLICKTKYRQILRKLGAQCATCLSTSDFQSEVGEVFGEIGGELPAKFGRRFSSFFCWGKIVRIIFHQNSTADFTIKLHYEVLGCGRPYRFAQCLPLERPFLGIAHISTFGGPKRNHKTKESHEQHQRILWTIRGGYWSLPSKTRALRQIAPESSPERSAKNLCHAVSLWYLFCPQNLSQTQPTWVQLVRLATSGRSSEGP